MTASVKCTGRPQLGSPRLRAYLGLTALLLTAHLVNVEFMRTGGDGPSLSPAAVRLRLNPNTATAHELMLLPDIGPALAKRIIEYRQFVTSGPAFASAEDLDRVPGIGPVRVEKLRPFWTFDDAAPAASGAAP
jgi:competence protein ComEA